MRIQMIVVVLVSILLVMGLSGCIDTSNKQTQSAMENRFIGTWDVENGDSLSPLGTVTTFFSDGACSIYGGFSAIYEIKDGKLVITTGDGALQYIFDYYFSNSNTRLTIIPIASEESTVYIKR